jgi:hypothetical protein
MKQVRSIFAFVAIGMAGLAANGSANACRISMEFYASMKPNAIEIDNEARLKLADTVIRARAWPDEVLATVVTPALASENKPGELAQARYASIKAYLLMLGVKEENIVSDARVRPEARQSKQEQDKFRALDIEFTPNCYGHCAQLCEGTYTPTSK